MHSVVVTDEAGCQTSCTIEINEPLKIEVSIEEELCFGEGVQVGDNTYNYPGTYTNTLTSVNGCDSVVTLVLVVNPIHEILQAAESCDPQDGGVSIENLETGEGCDSVITTVTTVLENYNETVYQTSCDPSAVGTVEQNLVAENGCDSIVTIITSLVESYEITVEEFTCNPDEVGESVKTYVASTGCDSTVTTVTTLAPSYDITIEATSCNPSDVGIDIQTFTTTLGCDSIVRTNTTLVSEYATVINAESCDPTEVGTTTEVFTASSGCDSTVTTITTLAEGYNSITVLTSCNPLDTGYVTSYYASAQGCDSVVTIQTILVPSDEVVITENICPGTTYEFNGLTIGASGTYAATLNNAYGCDSIVVLNLTVDPYTESEISVQLCAGDSTTINGVDYYNSTGVYIDTIPGSDCDSIVTLNLDVPQELSIEETHTDIVCNGEANGTIDITVSNGFPPYTYNWSNGAEEEDLSGLASGEYTVTVTDNNGCEATLNVMIDEPSPIQITQTQVEVTCEALGSIDISVTGGVEPYEYEWLTGENVEDLTDLNVGIYIVTVTDSNGCEASLEVELGGVEYDSTQPTISTVSTVIVDSEPVTVCLDQEIELDGPISDVFICHQPTSVWYNYEVNGDEICFEFDRLDNEPATDSVCVITCDETECSPCDTTYIVVVVLPIGNGSPEVSDDCIEIESTDEAIDIDVLLNVVDPDGDDIFISQITQGPEHGTVTIENNGQNINYMPDFGYCGRDTFYFEVCDEFGGCNIGYVCMTIECECFVPNVLTPNNDGLNDFFEVPCLYEIENGFLRVYNRWGNEVYRNENYHNEWNGFYKGEPLPDGTYYYVLEFTDQQGQFRNLAGDLTILK